MHLRSAFEGRSVHRRSTSDTTPIPDLAHLYAKKPLPPLPQSPLSPTSLYEAPVPIPLPLNIKRKPSSARPSLTSQASLPGLNELRAETRSASPLPAPSTPISASRSRRFSRASPGHRSFKKVLQLMGQDVDVLLPPGTIHADHEPPHPAGPFRRGIEVLTPDMAFHRRSPDMHRAPSLEADLDGMSSRNSSWTPSSPLSAVMIPLSTFHPVIRRSHSSRFGECDSPSGSSDRSSVSSRWDPPVYDMATNEYHKFAVELASRTERNDIEDDIVLPLDAKAKGRQSTFLSFSANAQFSQRRHRPRSIDPSITRFSTGSNQVEEKPLPALQPQLPSEVEEIVVPRSAFDYDSDDERLSRSRSRWRKVPPVPPKSEERGRDSSAGVQGLMRQRSLSRTWSRTGDQMKELLASAKKGLPAPKAERWMGKLGRDIKVLTEGIVA